MEVLRQAEVPISLLVTDVPGSEQLPGLLLEQMLMGESASAQAPKL